MSLPIKVDWAVTDVPFQKGQEAYIEFGKGCALLNSQGVTQQAIADRYEMGLSEVKRACVVGEDNRLEVRNTNFLPKSTYSLYLMTTLDDEDFEYVVEEFGEKTRQIDIAAVKAGFNTVEEWEFDKAWRAAIEENELRDRLRLIKDWAAALIEDKERFPDIKPEPEQKQPKLIPMGADPIAYLVELFKETIESNDPIVIKAVKQMFSTLYYPDTGKFRRDTEIMSKVNQALTSLEGARK